MRFSVIVPVYKVEKYLERCVQSVLHQTYKDFQLILVDDGSPDNCGSMCDAFARQDARVMVIHAENGGVSAARNRGIEAAQGSYITFVDADDYIAADFLEQAEHALQARPEADLIQFAWRDFPDGQLADETPAIVGDPVLWKKEDAMRAFLQFRVFAHAPWSKVIRKELLDGITFPTGVRVGEDLEVSYQLLGRAKSIVTTDAVAYYYCLRAGGAMGSRGVDGIRDAFTVVGRMYRYFSDNYPALKALYSRRYANDLMQLARDLTAVSPHPDKQKLHKEICAALEQIPREDIPDRSVKVLRRLLISYPRVYFTLYKLKR